MKDSSFVVLTAAGTLGKNEGQQIEYVNDSNKDEMTDEQCVLPGREEKPELRRHPLNRLKVSDHDDECGCWRGRLSKARSEAWKDDRGKRSPAQ